MLLECPLELQKSYTAMAISQQVRGEGPLTTEGATFVNIIYT